MNDLAERILRALVVGLIAGIVTALLCIVLSALIPGLTIDARFWGVVVGLIAGIYAFVTRRSVIG